MSHEAPARPWRSTSGRRSGIVADKWDGKGHLLDADTLGSARSDEEKYAIVDLVVKAVNSHDALVEALGMMLKYAELETLSKEQVDSAYAALTLARAGEETKSQN